MNNVGILCCLALLVPLLLSPVAAEENGSGDVVRHVNPWNVSERSDTSGLRSWFISDLSSRLDRSSLEITRERYDTAQKLVGEKYRRSLRGLVDVAESPGHERQAELYRHAGKRQGSLSQNVSRFHETYERGYLPAKRRGDEKTARRNARELARISDHVERDGETLQHIYANLSGQGRNLSEARARVNRVVKMVAATQSTVQENEQFTETNITLHLEKREASIREPLNGTGRVMAGGDPIPFATVEVTTGHHRVRTRTGPDGTYSFTLSPLHVPPGEARITSRYVPAPDTLHLDAEASSHYTVQTTNATVTLTRSPVTAAFGDPVEIVGHVAANGKPVPGLPVMLYIGDTRLGSSRTNASGLFSLSPELPATVPAGETALHIAPNFSSTSLRGTPAKTRLRIPTTGTHLTLRATGHPDHVTLRGALTAAGHPVKNAPVTLRTTGTQTEIHTGPGGVFHGTLDPQTSGNVTVTATFPGYGNLETSSTSTPATLPRPPEPPSSPGSSTPPLPLAAAAALLLTGAVTGFLLKREPAPGKTETDPDASGETADEAESRERNPLEAARTKRRYARLNETGELTYAAVRRALEPRVGTGPDRTHWEFYDACSRNGLPEDAVRDLRVLTELYERAAFAPRSLSVEEADEALRLGTRLTGSGDLSR